MNEILTKEQIDSFHKNGFLLIKNFYDVSNYIEPIQFHIYEIIKLVINKYNLPIQQKAFSSKTFFSGYLELIAHDRKLGSIVYDAIKQIPALIRLISLRENETIFKQLRNTDLAGLAPKGYGIRIDNPFEEKFRADWHQEYPAQLKSLDGLVFWTPLVNITQELGPVKICVSSHKGGLKKVHTKDINNPDKTAAYALILENKEKLISSYEQIDPLSGLGDLIIMDFLTLHCSGFNISQQSRWSIQFRYFNYKEPTGVQIEWKGAFAEGIDFSKIHPDLVAD